MDGWARPLYLGFATIGLVIPYPVLGNSVLGLVGALVVAAAGSSLFKVRTVAAYFDQKGTSTFLVKECLQPKADTFRPESSFQLPQAESCHPLLV